MPARRTAAACAIAALLLAGCQQGTGGGIDRETVGTLGGAAGGALLGSQIGGGGGRTVATAVGAVLGALAGRELARNLGDQDKERAIAAEEAAVTRNEQITWNNPDTGNRGTIAPTRSYTNDAGNLCREYTHTVHVDGRAETARGTACRQDDGTWRLVG
ncbi:RT0821/Lpp0805 family surface protein [Rhodocista pekingensis]|uniref:17 kDa surface antigen n=1 Tax=Rhodocista pekingensis TaxID=201185 RepID=A0ABW2KPQ8_9PROT